MARMLLENLAHGMRLNKPVLNPHGVLLLKAGEVLTEKYLATLMAWGVREADVVREDDGEPEVTAEAALPHQVLEAAETETAHRFRRAGTEGDPVMAEILRVVTLRLASRQAAPPAPRKQPGLETA